MKIAFLCNPAPHRRKKLPLLVSRIQKFVPAEREIFLVDRSVPNSLESHVERILDGGFERIIVAGGDGTLNRTVNALIIRNALHKVILGLIPFGTCNDFARSQGLYPRRISKVLKTVTKSSAKTINIARVNDHFFINNAGFGKRYAPEERKSGLEIVKKMVPVGVKAEWEKGVLRDKFYMMLCANAPFFSGGMRFSKASSPTDDVLDFFFVKKMMKLNLALRFIFGKARVPMHLSKFSKRILKVSAKKLKLDTEAPVSIAIDGEFRENLANVREATFEIAAHCRFLSYK